MKTVNLTMTATDKLRQLRAERLGTTESATTKNFKSARFKTSVATQYELLEDKIKTLKQDIKTRDKIDDLEDELKKLRATLTFKAGADKLDETLTAWEEKLEKLHDKLRASAANEDDEDNDSSSWKLRRMKKKGKKK